MVDHRNVTRQFGRTAVAATNPSPRWFASRWRWMPALMTLGLLTALTLWASGLAQAGLGSL